MSSLEMRQRRAALVAEARGVYARAEAERREPTAEESEQFDRTMGEVDRLAGEIERVERLEAEERELVAAIAPAHAAASGDDPDAARRAAFATYLRGGASALSAEQRGFLAPVTPEMRAAGAGTGSAGGYTVPAGFREVLIESQ